jgi:pimeloyl-ACP methyl ester carboxylesterase
MNRRDMLRTTAALVAAGVVPNMTRAAQPDGPTLLRITFGRDQLADLFRRLDATRWPDPVFETGWSQGTHLGVLRELVRYWRHGYDWEREQEGLNRLPHFTVPIEGERLHFLWYKGSGPRQPFPLLLIHGWPSTFLEFRDAAPLLLRGSSGRPGFDLVVPSLPGFALSDAPRSAGMHTGRMADRLHALMGVLGYRRYGVHGGDFGWSIGTTLGGRFPQAVVGLQLQGAPWSEPKGREPTPQERAFLDKDALFKSEGQAYGHIQGTRPQTLAVGLTDSPAGLLSWILDKYWDWSDHGEDLWASLDRDYVLTTVMLYWMTGRVLSSSRAYYDLRRRPAADRPTEVTVPTAFAPYPADRWSPPKSLFDPKEYKNVVRYTEPPRGGHFAAMEEPEFWADDLMAFFAGLTP